MNNGHFYGLFCTLLARVATSNTSLLDVSFNLGVAISQIKIKTNHALEKIEKK